MIFINIINENKKVNISYKKNQFGCKFKNKNSRSIFNYKCYIGLTQKSMTIFINVLFSTVIILLNNYRLKSFENSSDNISYDLVIPVNINDTKNVLGQIDLFKRYLNFDDIIIITPNIPEYVYGNKDVIFIREDLLVPKENLIEIMNNRGIEETKRIGWYEQQFLKMSYSRICKKKYYLLWDSDTIPIKRIKMFEDGIPIFDIQKEQYLPYFLTLERLIPDLHFSKFSYITEHMIIKTEYMKILLDTIENNFNIPGKMFWEKILISIDKEEILKSGFSEFETYGTFVDTKFPNNYKHRMWSSKRDATRFFGNINNVCQQDFNWLSKDYNAITFEKWDQFEKQNLVLVTNKNLQKLSRPKRFFKYFKRIKKKYRGIEKYG